MLRTSGVSPLVVVSLALQVCGQDWDYGSIHSGPENWKTKYPACGSSGQSPIDIDTDYVWYGTGLIAFELEEYHHIPANMHWEMVNTGKTVGIFMTGGEYILQEGGLIGQYKAAQFHFHWGSDDVWGSEHALDGVSGPLELHIVHYAERYGSLEEAAKYPGGIAILAFLFEISKLDNPSYKYLLNNLKNITYPGDRIVVRPIPLLSLLPLNINHYYRYMGSMTTPPCTENVIWTVFRNLIPISSRQMRILRTSLMSTARGELGRPLVGNFRPLQPLGDRTVFSSCPEHATLFTSPMTSPVSMTIAAFVGIMLVILYMKYGYKDGPVD